MKRGQMNTFFKIFGHIGDIVRNVQKGMTWLGDSMRFGGLLSRVLKGKIPGEASKKTYQKELHHTGM